MQYAATYVFKHFNFMWLNQLYSGIFRTRNIFWIKMSWVRAYVCARHIVSCFFIISYHLMHTEIFCLQIVNPFVCLFVCLGFIVSLENFSLIRRRHHYQWRPANFYLCSALKAIELWGFFCVPHLLWHGASVYNGQLLGPVTLTPIAENDLGLSLLEFEHPTFTTTTFTTSYYYYYWVANDEMVQSHKQNNHKYIKMQTYLNATHVHNI